jgi:hypothetical protein
VGGPQDPAVLYTAADVATDLAAVDASAEVERVERVERPVANADRPALDALFRARKGEPVCIKKVAPSRGRGPAGRRS